MSLHEGHLAHMAAMMANGSHLHAQHGGMHDMHEMVHSEHANTNHHMDHSGIKLDQGAEAASACSSHMSHGAGHMMSVSCLPTCFFFC